MRWWQHRRFPVRFRGFVTDCLFFAFSSDFLQHMHLDVNDILLPLVLRPVTYIFFYLAASISSAEAKTLIHRTANRLKWVSRGSYLSHHEPPPACKVQSFKNTSSFMVSSGKRHQMTIMLLSVEDRIAHHTQLVQWLCLTSSTNFLPVSINVYSRDRDWPHHGTVFDVGPPLRLCCMAVADGCNQRGSLRSALRSYLDYITSLSTTAQVHPP
jgi:hypothetical protein